MLIKDKDVDSKFHPIKISFEYLNIQKSVSLRHCPPFGYKTLCKTTFILNR